MATVRERRQTDHETDEIMSNSQSDMSSQDELLMGLIAYLLIPMMKIFHQHVSGTVGYSRQAYRSFFGKLVLHNMISLVERTPVDYFKLFFNDTTM